MDENTGILVIEMSDKTEAGHRAVPVHDAIKPLIQQLCRSADAEGFILPTTARNKYDERSTAFGKRFGRLKTKLGFDARYVFHSIRKSVATLFEQADCPESVAADILGHDKPTMTYGLYSGDTSLKQRQYWISQAICFPDQEFMNNVKVK